MNLRNWYATASALAVTAMLALPVNAEVKIEDIVNDAATPGDVVTNGLGPQGQRFSTLKAVNAETVGNLVPVWAFSLGGEKQRGQETQPLVKDGVMYLTGSYSRMWAIDTKTGHKIWEYNHRLPEGILPCCDVVNRGAALYGDNVYLRHPRRQARRAQREDRQGRLDEGDRGLQGRLLVHRRSAHRSVQGARPDPRHRRVGRRVRHRRPRRGPQGLRR